MTLSTKPKISFFLDSGAHALYTFALRGKSVKDYSVYYESDEFWAYVDSYAKYLQEKQSVFDVAVNVDVIFQPEMSWKVQKYLEDNYKLNIIPVVHFGAEDKWLKLYMDNYEYIGLGGMGQEVSKLAYMKYGDRTFKTLCDDKGWPLRKTHGFALTSIDIMLRYPFYSVDSSTWLIGEKFGLLLIPKGKRGKYDYNIPPAMISVTSRTGTKRANVRNLISEVSKNHILDYAYNTMGYGYGESEFCQVENGYKLGTAAPMEYWTNKEHTEIERVIVEGIGNSMRYRNNLNVHYFMELETYLRNNPKPFKPELNNFGLL